MPQWMRRQLQRAFNGKDVRQIRVLNSCWFLYWEKNGGRPD